MIRAIVGAGGKTGLIRRMAKTFQKEGKRVLVTTSTHMMAEEDTLFTDDAKEIIRQLTKTGYVMAGLLEGSKIKALSKETYEAVCAYADEVLIEADGGKHYPLKYPAKWEPVIYDNVQEVVVVCGLHGLGKPAKEAVHRLELAKEAVGIEEDTVIDGTTIQKLVRKGYLEHMKGAKIKAMNHDGSLYQRVLAKLLEADTDVSLIKEEWFRRQPTLVICGGGHVAYELVRMAALLDYKIKVVDDREEFANKERFADADEVICDSFENLNRYLEKGAYYVVVTRGHQADYRCVEQILSSEYEYLGMIGSKKKIAASFERLEAAGFTKEQIESIHAPIGLKIGAVTPAEIAVSILSELILEKNKKQASYISGKLAKTREKGTLCIITEKTGSAPRGKGSMMFVGAEGTVDTIGGGVLEKEVTEDAKSVREVMTKEYRLDGNSSAQAGMICGGTCQILFVPLERE